MASIHQVTRARMTREFSCDAGTKCSPGHLRPAARPSPGLQLDETALASADRRTASAVIRRRAASQAATAVGAHFISGGPRFALGRNRSRGHQGRAPDRTSAAPISVLADPVGLSESRATRHRHQPPSCCTCARAMLAKPRFWGCRYPSCRPEIEVPLEFQGLGSLGAARGDGFSLANLTA
jgi:hypothetical protein